jgi:MFS family permease
MSSHHQKPTASPLWRNRDYLLLQGGQLVSSLGTQQQSFALPLLVFALTGSVVQAGIVVSLNTSAVLVVSPLAGVLADHWNRKWTMLLCDAGRMMLTCTIPLAYSFHALSLLYLSVVVALAGVLGTLFSTAQTAALPNVVTREQLPLALAQSQMASSSVRTVGSLVGGALYSIGMVFPFLANAVSFGVSVASLSLLRGPFQSKREQASLPFTKAVTEGMPWLWQQPLLRFLTLVNGADNVRYGAGYLVILVLARNLHTSSSGIGAIFTAAAVGALLGNLASTWVRQRLPFGTIAVSMLWLEALMFPLYAVAPNAVVMGCIAAAEELVGPIYTVAIDTYRLTATPDALRGRMSSSVQWVIQGAQSIGAIGGGLLIQGIGAESSALLLGGWLLLLALTTTGNRRVRRAVLPMPEVLEQAETRC